VRPRAQVRFWSHVTTAALEVVTVTPAFLRYHDNFYHVACTTVTTYLLSLVVGYMLDLSTRRVFLQSAQRQLLPTVSKKLMEAEASRRAADHRM